MATGGKCVTCQADLAGRQRRFCSLPCKNADTNNRHQNYVKQQERGLRRKLLLIQQAGGCCTQCGYLRNAAALTWHHLDPEAKSFQLDMRSLSNRCEREIMCELAKCVLLCANCHAETHAPHLFLHLQCEVSEQPPDPDDPLQREPCRCSDAVYVAYSAT